MTIELLALESAEPPAGGQVALTGDEASFAAVFAELTSEPVLPAPDAVPLDAFAEDLAQSENAVVDPAAILALRSDPEMPPEAQPVGLANPDSASNQVADSDHAPRHPVAGETIVVVPDVPDAAVVPRVTAASAPIAQSARLAQPEPPAAPSAELEPPEAVAAVAARSVGAAAAGAVPAGPVAAGDSRACSSQTPSLEMPAPDAVASSEVARFEAHARQLPVGPEPEHPAEAPRSQAGSDEPGHRAPALALVARPEEAFEMLTPAPPPMPARANGVAAETHSAPPADATSGRPPLVETFAPAGQVPAGAVTRGPDNLAAEADAGGADDRPFEHRGEGHALRAPLPTPELARALGAAEPAVETPLPAVEPPPPHPPRAATASAPVPVQPVAPSAPSQAFTAPAAMRAFAPPAEHDDVVVPQLVRAMHLQMVRGVGEARLHLEPQHLGAVSVALRVANGVVSAVVAAEQPSVRHWIEAHESTLRQALADQGLELEKLQVHEDGRSPFHDSDRHDEPRRRRTPRRDTATFELVA